MWTQWGKERVERIERVALRYILCIKYIADGKQLGSTGSSARCSVVTQRDRLGMGREGDSREGIYVYL